MNTLLKIASRPFSGLVRPADLKKPREDPSSLRRSFDAPSLSGLRLRLSRHRRLALVISHSIVDSVAGHRSCGRTEERTPEATAGRGRSRLIHSLVDDGRVLLHDCRALRCIALRRSRTGEGTTAAEPTTTSCFRSCRNEKGDRNGRHNSFLHAVPQKMKQKPLITDTRATNEKTAKTREATIESTFSLFSALSSSGIFFKTRPQAQ